MSIVWAASSSVPVISQKYSDENKRVTSGQAAERFFVVHNDPEGGLPRSKERGGSGFADL